MTDTTSTCPDCQGKGYIDSTFQGKPRRYNCHLCHGIGRVDDTGGAKDSKPITVFATLGKKCGEAHYYQLVRSPIGGVTLREVENIRGMKLDKVYFDEAESEILAHIHADQQGREPYSTHVDNGRTSNTQPGETAGSSQVDTLDRILNEYYSDRTSASKAGDGTGTRTHAHRRARRRVEALLYADQQAARIDQMERMKNAQHWTEYGHELVIDNKWVIEELRSLQDQRENTDE